jgi:hypothetical protein
MLQTKECVANGWYAVMLKQAWTCYSWCLIIIESDDLSKAVVFKVLSLNAAQND